MSIRIVDLDERNVNDALYACTDPSRLNDNNIVAGLEIRRKWLLSLYRKMGPCAKIAYIADNPVGIIQYTPLHVIPYLKTRRKDVLYIHCMYVQEEFRRRGVGSELLEAVKSEMSKPNKMFKKPLCQLLATSARKHYGYIQFGLFRTKGFQKTRNNIDTAFVCPLPDRNPELKLDISTNRPRTIKEKGVKIFFKPNCQYCRTTNEMIKTEIRKINHKAKIEELNLWTCYREALRRRITSVATYIDGYPVLPMEPNKFLKTIRRQAAQGRCQRDCQAFSKSVSVNLSSHILLAVEY